MPRGKGIGDLWKYDPTYIMAKASKKIAGQVAKKGPKVVKKVTRDPMNLLDPTRGIGNTIKEGTRSSRKPDPKKKKMPGKVPSTAKRKPMPSRVSPTRPKPNYKPMPKSVKRPRSK